MKNLFIFVFIFATSNCFAQKVISGSFALPESETYLYVDWDFSETLFEKKYNEKEWEAMNAGEWTKAKSEALGFILNEMNEILKKSRIIVIQKGSDLKAEYTLYISAIKLDRKGNNKSFFILKKNDSGEEIGKAQIKGDGGHWGSLGNLLGDGYEEAARKMGSLLKKNNKLKK